MMEKFLLIVINISLPPSFFTQLDDDVLSDNIIENSPNLNWVAGRNFPENEAKELAKGIVNYINLDEINTLDTPNYRTAHYKHIPSWFDARYQWPKCKDLISSSLRYVPVCVDDVWVRPQIVKLLLKVMIGCCPR
jgi:hypothetical protein